MTAADLCENCGTAWPHSTLERGCCDACCHRHLQDCDCNLCVAPKWTHVYTVEDGPKMLLETLCILESALSHSPYAMDHRVHEHRARLQRLMDECERKRPTGNDGKHDDRHTAECGCDS